MTATFMFATLDPRAARGFLDSPGVIAMPDEAKDLIVDLVRAGAVRVQDPAYHPSTGIVPVRDFTADERITIARIGILIDQRPRIAPKRVQMSRKHPWRAEHPDAVIVARPSRWGNPYEVVKQFGEWGVRPPGHPLIEPMTASLTKAEAARHAVAFYRSSAVWRADEIRAALAGRDLACWCKPGDPCHGDVLLEIANEARL